MKTTEELKKSVEDIVKGWETEGEGKPFFEYFASKDKDALKALPLDKEAWSFYMENFAKSVNLAEGNKNWEHIEIVKAKCPSEKIMSEKKETAEEKKE